VRGNFEIPYNKLKNNSNHELTLMNTKNRNNIVAVRFIAQIVG